MSKKNIGSTVKRGALGTVVALLASLASAPMASAGVWSNHSGNICKGMNDGFDSFLYSGPVGTGTFKTSGEMVISCPLVRRTSNTNGAGIFVDVYHAGWQTTRYVARSYRPGGSALASTDVSWAGSGIGSVFLNLAGPGKSSFSSDYSVYCYIPLNLKGYVSGVHLDER
jgi:hypothetical protein